MSQHLFLFKKTINQPQGTKDKQMIQIRNRFTNEVMISVDTDNLSDADLSGANLSDADLSGANLSDADLSGANLSYADLKGADLSYADLKGADLKRADLSGADLIRADLSGANLSYADLRNAGLSGANLSGANLDFSCLHFSCKSRMAKTDRRQRVQLAHHLLSWMKYADNLNEDEKQIFEQLKAYANEFHRADVEKF